MKLGLREIGAVAALATAGCTPEDAKNEAHPVYAVPDVHSDTITEEMVENTRQKCFAAAVRNAVVFGATMVQAGADRELALDMFESAKDKSEAECLALHGLEGNP